MEKKFRRGLLLLLLCGISAIGGAIGRDYVPQSVKDLFERTPKSERKLGLFLSTYDFCLRKGEELKLNYKPSQDVFLFTNKLPVRYEGLTNKEGNLDVYLDGVLAPLKVGDSVETNRDKEGFYELKAVETISDGNDPAGIVHLQLSRRPFIE